MERDLRTILVVQGLRAFLYGFGSVLIGSVLATRGLSDAAVGAIFTAMLAGMALSSLAVARYAHRVSRVRLYSALLAGMGVAGAAFAATAWPPALVLVALTGLLSTDPNESGPITSLEQAMIGAAPQTTRIRVFGRYNAVAYLSGSAGALAAGGPAALRDVLPRLPSDQRWLLLFPVIAMIAAAIASRLSPAVEAQRGDDARRGPVHRNIKRLAALFALDAFAGGFIVQAFLVFWFKRRFGVSTEQMGLAFFGIGLLQAASSIAAARLAAGIGLLNTMVFTHLPSNVCLMAVPFAPTFPLAVALLLARSALSQMDVPARQAYVVAIAPPHERTAAAAYTNGARYLARPLGPVLGGMLTPLAVAAPFVAAGAMKIVYDLLLYASFRRVELDEHEPAP